MALFTTIRSVGQINIISCWSLNDMVSFDLVGSVSEFSLNCGWPLESNMAYGKNTVALEFLLKVAPSESPQICMAGFSAILSKFPPHPVLSSSAGGVTRTKSLQPN